LAALQRLPAPSHGFHSAIRTPNSAIMRAFFHFLLRLLFRFRAYNTAVLDTPGPVLLLPNHVSWIDWLFLVVLMDKDWKVVVSSTAAEESWLHRKIMINERTFPVDTASPYAVKRMAEHLQKGGRLVLFPEGRLSRTGALMKVFDGTGFLLFKTSAKVITCYLRGAHRVLKCEHPGWRKWFPTVTAHFSEVVTPPKPENLSTTQARKILTNWLRDRLIEQQFRVEMEFGPGNVLAAIAEVARERPKQLILEDATYNELTYRRLLVGADLMARQLEQVQGGRGSTRAQTVSQGGGGTPPSHTGERVGVLLPNINATPVVLMALWSLGKVPAILNFSTGMATMLACAQLAGLKHIVTSRKFLERAKIKAEPFAGADIQLLYLEDLREQITGAQRFFSLLRISLNPQSVIRHLQSTDDTAVILFTSGSEGVPKGVELSHKNILANIRQMLGVTDLMDTDRLFNCLPLFHSFGLTVGLLLPLVRGFYVFIYPSPLHYRVVPSAFYDRDCTIFLSTNTFLNGYARKAHPYDFRSMRYMFAAAEKLQEATAQTWAQKYGVRILEGYGATECSPCVSLNTPLLPKHGCVGRLLPGIEHKLEPVEGVADGGRLFVRGPNVMKGYLNPEANSQFQSLGGWYDTGDIVSVDAEGCLHIRGRMKRFAKVSGEMVSLTAVEDALAGAFPHYGLRCQVAVLTRPDEDKGEALIAVTNEPKLQLGEIREAIKAKGLSNLCVPREIKVVKEIPKLGTGKVNHRELQKQLIP
jgi:acyl-[acyl-carrier-protein]-phospholipid O-acyltransferase/long-chain-fatty-acid--[acyl-carrier-protein] ligase